MTLHAGKAKPPQGSTRRDAGLAGLSTARLMLRRFTVEDEALLLTLNSSERVMRYIDAPMDAQTNRAHLFERILGYYDQHPGFGAWATIERASGRCIGLHLLNHIRGETLIQVGYRLFEVDWGKGYATEMTVALLRYGFVDRGLDTIVAITSPDNLASQRVLLKSGLARNGERSFAKYAQHGAMPFFERKASDWLDEFGR